MSRMKSAALLMAVATIGATSGHGSHYWDEDHLNDRGKYKGKGFSGGQQKIRVFVINGVSIKATDMKMAKKKYSALKNRQQ